MNSGTFAEIGLLRVRQLFVVQAVTALSWRDRSLSKQVLYLPHKSFIYSDLILMWGEFSES